MYDSSTKTKLLKQKSGKIVRNKLNRSMGGNLFIFFLLALLGIFTSLPLYLAIVNSLKPLNELWIFPPRFYVANPTMKNFTDLFTMMGSSTVPFSRYIFNTIFITLVGTSGQIIITSLFAYPLAKHNFPGSKVIFRIIVLSLMFSHS